jgi:hypothetical protein
VADNNSSKDTIGPFTMAFPFGIMGPPSAAADPSTVLGPTGHCILERQHRSVSPHEGEDRAQDRGAALLHNRLAVNRPGKILDRGSAVRLTLEMIEDGALGPSVAAAHD